MNGSTKCKSPARGEDISTGRTGLPGLEMKDPASGGVTENHETENETNEIHRIPSVPLILSEKNT
jgi:hypothetical protein